MGIFNFLDTVAENVNNFSNKIQNVRNFVDIVRDPAQLISNIRSRSLPSGAVQIHFSPLGRKGLSNGPTKQYLYHDGQSGVQSVQSGPNWSGGRTVGGCLFRQI